MNNQDVGNSSSPEREIGRVDPRAESKSARDDDAIVNSGDSLQAVIAIKEAAAEIP